VGGQALKEAAPAAAHTEQVGELPHALGEAARPTAGLDDLGDLADPGGGQRQGDRDDRADGLLELTIKADPRGLVSRYLHRTAARGTVLGLSQPDGGFTLPQRRPDRVLLISGGSGITPVLSMLRTLVDEGHAGDVTFLHYADGADDVLYRAELAELARRHPGLRVVLAYTDRDDGGDLHGFFSAGHLAAAAPWYRDAQTYLCGPKPLMDSVRDLFDAQDLSE